MSAPVEDTQLTPARGYNAKERMIFSDPQESVIPNSDPPLKYKRINIKTTNEDGTVGDLILQTERLFSFGVQENTSPETKKVTGYVMPLCLWNRNGATQGEKDFITAVDNITKTAKDYLLTDEVKDSIERYDLEAAELKKFDPIYRKKEKGKVVEGKGPVLYCKIIESKKLGKVLTMFHDLNGEPIPFSEVRDKYCHVNPAAVKFESIYIGKDISLQIKLYEATVEFSGSKMVPLLKKRPDAEKRVLTKPTSNKGSAPVGNDEDEVSDVGSVEPSDNDEPEPETEPEPKKKIVKRTVKKAVKKT